MTSDRPKPVWFFLSGARVRCTQTQNGRWRFTFPNKVSVISDYENPGHNLLRCALYHSFRFLGKDMEMRHVCKWNIRWPEDLPDRLRMLVISQLQATIRAAAQTGEENWEQFIIDQHHAAAVARLTQEATPVSVILFDIASMAAHAASIPDDCRIYFNEATETQPRKRT